MLSIDLVTSVVGSFPLVHSPSAAGKQLLVEFRKETGFELSSLFDFLVAHAVIDQLLVAICEDGKPGLDIIGTGQPCISVLGNMNLPYYELLSGIDVDQERGVPIVRLSGGPAQIDFKGWKGQAFFRELEIASAILQYCRHSRLWSTGLRVSLTGPVTLFCGIHEGTHDEDTGVVARLANALVKVVQEIERRKEISEVVFEVVIDEPAITQAEKVAKWDGALYLLPELVEKLVETGFRVSLHICGRIDADLLQRVGSPKLFCFDLEVAHVLASDIDETYLADIRRAADGEDAPKHWALGCLNVASHRLEVPEQISGLCDLLANYVDRDRIILKPDCGLRGLSLDEARAKLRSLCKAGEVERSRRRERFLEQLASDQAAIRTEVDVGSLNERLHGRLRLSRVGKEFPAVGEMQSRFNEYLTKTLIGPLLSGFTSHGPEHSKSVLHLVSQLMGEAYFSPQEERVLYLAAFGHDIGLHAPLGSNPLIFSEEAITRPLIEKYYGQDSWPAVQGWTEGGEASESNRLWWEGVRRFHGLRSALIVRQSNADERLLDADELSAFEATVASHQTRSIIPSGQRDGDLRTDLLCAVLRIADECDVSRQRMPTPDMVRSARLLATRSDDDQNQSTEYTRRDAARALIEYWKNDLFDAIWFDHRCQAIRLFHAAVEEQDFRLVESVRVAIERNLRVGQEFLRFGGILISEVIVEPTPPSVVSTLLGARRFRLRGKGLEPDISRALEISG